MVKLVWQYIIGLVVFALVLIACSDLGNSQVIKQLDREGQPVIVTVYFYDTQKELKQALQRYNPADGLQGMAIWSESDNECTIHTLAIKRVDDEATKTLGHEMLHCIYGSYH